MDFISIISGFAIFMVVLKIYTKVSAGVCRSKRSLEGKTAMVTGSNTGIGLETARDFAKRKARVILACRNMDKAYVAAKDIMKTTGNTNVVVRHLDLSSMKSIQKFAEEILETESKLDILVHNAAHSPPPGKYMTEDNLEVQFATNHFGPFLLNHLLLDLLKKSAPSRIVVVSSVMHNFAGFDFDNLNMEKCVRNPLLVYNTTKLANLLFTKELSRRLEGTGVTVNAVHPGGVKTDITRNSDWFVTYIMVPVFYFFLKNPKVGAQTTIYAAISEELDGVSGEYFADCRRSWTSQKARDKKLAKRLWELSEKVTGITSGQKNGQK